MNSEKEEKNDSSIAEGAAGGTVNFSLASGVLKWKDSTYKPCCEAGELQLPKETDVPLFHVSTKKRQL